MKAEVAESATRPIHTADPRAAYLAHQTCSPPLLWNSVFFRNPATVLAVFCDEPYDPADYLVDWDEYLEAKRLRQRSRHP